MSKEKADMKIRCYVVILIVLLLALSACKSVASDETLALDDLKMLDGVDRIEVYGSDRNEEEVWEQYLIKTIDDPEQVGTIVEIFHTYADNWQIGQYKPYLPGRVTVGFYDEDELKTSIIIVSYTTRDDVDEQMSYFLSKLYGPTRPIEETEFKGLMELLEIDEDLAYYGDLTGG